MDWFHERGVLVLVKEKLVRKGKSGVWRVAVGVSGMYGLGMDEGGGVVDAAVEIDAGDGD